MIRVDGVQEIILDRLMKNEFYKTKSEAIRAGILELATKYKVFGSEKEIANELAVRKMKRISEEIKIGKRKEFTESQVREKYGFK